MVNTSCNSSRMSASSSMESMCFFMGVSRLGGSGAGGAVADAHRHDAADDLVLVMERNQAEMDRNGLAGAVEEHGRAFLDFTTVSHGGNKWVLGGTGVRR